MKLKPVIMAGGSGKRLWPLSSSTVAKQFMRINAQYSSFQETLLRNKNLGKPLIMVNASNSKLAKQQLDELELEGDFVIEPVQRDTGPCALVAALLAKAYGFTDLVLIPADHAITDLDIYLKTIKAAAYNLHFYQISIIGIKPTHPSTNYGYIHTKECIGNNIYSGDHFIEKPASVKAENYVKDGNYLWNSGLYILKAQFVIDKFIHKHNNLFLNVNMAVNHASHTSDYIILAREFYEQVQSISFDYAIIEDIKQVVVIKAEFGWHDLGNWQSLWSVSDKDDNENYLSGQVIAKMVNNSYIKSHNRQTIVIGLDNIIVVETKDGLLIADRSRASELKAIEVGLLMNE